MLKYCSYYAQIQNQVAYTSSVSKAVCVLLQQFSEVIYLHYEGCNNLHTPQLMRLRESLPTRMNLLLVEFESFRYVALLASFLCKLILALRVLRRLYRLYILS